MGGTITLMDGIRNKIKHWVITNEPLLSDAVAGSSTINIRSTRRYRPGDEFLIRDADQNTEEGILIDEIIDNTHMTLQSPLRMTWRVSDMSSVVRTFDGDYVKAIHFGEPNNIILSELPCITVNTAKSSSEWYTTRSTKERFDTEIGVFVSGDTDESGNRRLRKITECIENGLKKNLYPLANEYAQTSLLANVSKDDTFIRIPDTTIFQKYHLIMLENNHYMQEFVIKCIVNSTTLELALPSYFDFNKSETNVIVPYRFFFNSWPADTNFGKIAKGSFLKAASISFFCEEVEDQINTSWYDTQLR